MSTGVLDPNLVDRRRRNALSLAVTCRWVGLALYLMAVFAVGAAWVLDVLPALIDGYTAGD